MFKMFAQPPFDKDALMSMHRKNLEAVAEANKIAMDVIKSVTQLQSQYIRQAFEDMSAMVRDVSAQPFAQETWDKQVSCMKNNINQAVEHSTKMASVVAESHKDIHRTFKDRMASNVSDMKDSSFHKAKATKQ